MESAQALIDRIVRDYQDDRIKVPSLPDVAVKVRQSMADENTNAEKLARIIQMDPALTAKLIQVANSPVMRGGYKVEDCQKAIARLGMETTRNVVTSFALRQIFEARRMKHRDYITRMWRNSTHVAAISFVLAEITVGVLPDRAMLAGLLCEVGVLPVIYYAEQYPDLYADVDRLNRVINKTRAKLGCLMLRQWGFDKEMVALPRESEKLQRDPARSADYADIVMIARLHQKFCKNGHYQGPPLDTIPAYSKLPLSKLGVSSSDELLRTAKDEIDNIMNMLQS
jgi:HD-like signal output (HDOD) protein